MAGGAAAEILAPLRGAYWIATGMAAPTPAIARKPRYLFKKSLFAMTASQSER